MKRSKNNHLKEFIKRDIVNLKTRKRRGKKLNSGDLDNLIIWGYFLKQLTCQKNE